MSKQTPLKRVLLPRGLTWAIVGLFTVAAFLGGFVVFTDTTASAATNNTLNFQARLEGAAGNIAPDGYYNVQFKLYNVSGAGTSLWTESYIDENGATAGDDYRIRVQNGYLSVSLGSRTAFPSTINWDQDMWITMNIGGTAQTATPTYDGEMSPRLKLTGVPYAFRAGQLAQYNATSGFTSTLSLLQPTVGNQTFQIADQAAAGTYTLCIQNSTACGFAANSGGSGYIQNQNTAAQTTANFWISGTGTATMLQSTTLDRPNAGTLSIGTTNATSILLGQNTSLAAGKSLQIGAGGTLQATLKAPVAASISAAATGGSLAAGTYYYVVTAVDGAGGETNVSNELSITTTGTTSVVSLSVTPSASGFVTYRVYRGTTAGGQSGYLSTLIFNSTGTNFTLTDSGSALTTGTPPTANTANALRFNSGGTNYILGHRLGVGTGAPNYALDVFGDINTSGVLRVAGSQIATSNLSDNSNIAKKDAANDFAATNTFRSRITLGVPNGYSTAAMAFESTTFTGTAVTLADDASTPAITLPFTFNFYKNDQTSLHISSNGFVSFGAGHSITSGTIPSSTIPNNSIFGFWRDLDPSKGGTITHGTVGTAPNRIFIVEYKDILNFGSTTVKNTFQIKLFETSNNIELHCVSCTGTATQGIENSDGTIANFLSGRNTNSSLTLTNDAVRFTASTGGAFSLLNNAGTLEFKSADANVLTFGGSGAATFKNVTDSTTAFQIQNAAGNSLLNADATNLKLSVTQSNMVLAGFATPAAPTLAAAANQGGTLSGAAATTYYYKISALNAAGESIGSAESSINGQSFTKLTPPGAPTVAINATAGNLNGSYTYKITFVTANGETVGGTTSAAVAPASQQVDLTAIPTGPAGTTARKIYRTAAAGADGTQKLVATLADNTTAAYLDNVADASLGAALPAANTATTNTNNATVTFTAVAGATSYRVYRGATAGGQNSYQTVTASPFTDTGAAGTSGSTQITDTTARLGVGTATPGASLHVAGTALFKNLADSVAAVQVQNSAGTSALTVDTNALRVTMADTVIAAGKSLTVTGGTTATRPAAPTEGMLYYDTTTKQLLVYANGKWQADRSTATKIVAANDSLGKDGADFVVSSADETAGNADAAIQAAIAALPATGGSVYLMEGTYTIDTGLRLPSNAALTGSGASTIIKLKSGINANIYAIQNADTANGNYRVKISNLRLDGNKANNTAGTQIGIYTYKVGYNTNQGLAVHNVYIENFRNFGIYLDSFTHGAILTGNTLHSNGADGIYTNGNTEYATITGNNAVSNGGEGIQVRGNSASVANNSAKSNTGTGLYVFTSVGFTITGNVSSLNGQSGIHIWGGQGTVTSNAVNSNTGNGISTFQAENTTITGNRIVSNAGGVITSSARRLNISSNIIRANSGYGVSLAGSFAEYNAVSDNILFDNGGTGASSGIYLSTTLASPGNTIKGNDITDTAGTGFAIDIGATGVKAFLSGNTYSGTGASAIRDNGKDTIYEGQVDVNGNLITKGTNGVGIATTTVNHTLSLQGALGIAQLPAPTAPTVAVVGTTGTTTYTYAVTATDGLGETVLSTATSTTTGNATIDATNFNRITWIRVSGAMSYKVYRTASGGTPGTTGLIGTVTSSSALMQLEDKGLAVTGSAPTANTTGGGKFAGAIQGTGAVLSGSDALFLGQSSVVNGAITLYNAGNANTIRLAAPGNASSSYTLTLPVDAPAVSQCLQSDATTASQLVFGSCAAGSATTLQGAYDNSTSPATITTSSAAKGIVIKSGTGFDSASMFQIQNAAGTNAFTVDTVNNRVGIGLAAPTVSLDVRLPGTSTGTLAVFGNVTNGAYGRIATRSTDNAFLIKGDANAPLSLGANNQEDNLLIGLNGQTTLKNSTNSATAFQIQNAAASPLLTMDSTNNKLTVNQGGLDIKGLANPATPTLSSAATGGSLAAATYTYRLAATSGAGETQAILSSPGSVTTTGTTSSNTVSWTAVTYATGYRLYRSTDGGTNWSVNVLAAGTTSAVDNGTNFTWATAGFPDPFSNTTGKLTMAPGASIILDQASGSGFRYDATGKSFVMGAFESGGVALIQGDSLIFQDTTGYNTNLRILNTGETRLRNRVNSAAAFQIQNSAGTSVLTVDTTSMQISVGSGANTIVLSSTGYTASGTARNSKRIMLTAEYAGAVLDAGTGIDNTGSMTSGVNITNRMNYYKWTTTQATNQSYDVVLQIPIPKDFSAWGSTTPISVSTFSSDLTNGTLAFELRDSANTVALNFVSVTPTAINSWQSLNPGTVTGTYTDGDYLTIRVRMQSPNGGDVRVGNITMDYLSKF